MSAMGVDLPRPRVGEFTLIVLAGEGVIKGRGGDSAGQPASVLQ